MTTCYIYNPIGCAHSQPDHSSLFKCIFPPIFNLYYKLSEHLLFLFLLFFFTLPVLQPSSPPYSIYSLHFSTLYCSLFSTLYCSLHSLYCSLFSTLYCSLPSTVLYILSTALCSLPSTVFTLYCFPLSTVLYSLMFSTLFYFLSPVLGPADVVADGDVNSATHFCSLYCKRF